jgi:hemoglobin/transferrin/lactoferrin receptor protein
MLYRRVIAAGLSGFIAPGLFGFSAAGLFAPAFAQAQSPVQPASEQQIETVTVWATQVTSTAMPVSDTALSLRQADHVSDLLRDLPGVDVGGAHSLNQRITIRGMDDKDLRVTIDGAVQNTYMFHHMGNLQIHADILKSADLAVGSNSVLDGGLGGAARFYTKDARELLKPGQTWGGFLQGAYASNRQDSLAAATYGQLGDSLDLLLYANGVKRGNFKVGGGTLFDENNQIVDGTHGQVEGIDGDLTDVLGKLGWQISNNQRLKIGHERYEDSGDYAARPDMGLATGRKIQQNLGIPLVFPTKFTRATSTLNYSWEPGSWLDVQLNLFDNQSEFWRDERGLGVWRPDSATINTGQADNQGFNLLAKSTLGEANQLTYGVEQVKYSTQFLRDGSEEGAESSRTSSVYLQDEISLDEQWRLTPGLRYDSADLNSTLTNNTFDALSPALAVEFSPTQYLTTRLSSTGLFKAPELGEVFLGAGSEDEANPGIEAETGRNTQWSIAYEAPLAGIEQLSSGFTLFRSDIDQYIYDYAETDTFYGKDNIGSMASKGYETYVGVNHGPFKALLTYSHATSDLAAEPPYESLAGARLDREQGDSLSFNLDYRLEAYRLDLNWNWQWVDSLAAGKALDAPEHNRKPGYRLHSLAANWQATEAFNLSLAVENLFDAYYASQSSQNGTSIHPRFGELYLMDYEPGRNIKLRLAYRL